MKNYPVYEIQKFNCDLVSEEIYVNTFKNHLQNHSFIEKSHSHNFFLLVAFTNGTGQHTIDFETYAISPGTVFVLQPGQIHSWELSKDIDGYILFYTHAFYNLHFATKRVEQYPFFKSLKNHPKLDLSHGNILKIIPYFEELITEFQHHFQHKKDKMKALVDLLLIELARNYQTTETHQSSTYQQKLAQFEELLEIHFKTEKAPVFYANQLNISLKHLNRICKEVLNQTVTELIRKRVILESKRMLTLGQFNISEIAHNLGFESPSYFTKLFKNQTGFRPKEFIKNTL